MNKPYPIVFSDLDNCLLDRDDYGFAAATDALEALRRHGIPLILVSSKTRREMEAVRLLLDLDTPFIAESGAALYIPRDFAGLGELPPGGDGRYALIEWGLPYATIRQALAEAARTFAVRGFGDMEPAEVAALTGLHLTQASLAAAREYTEPFLLEEPARLLPLIAWAAERGLQVLAGGRFHHLAAAAQDKGRAVTFLCERFRRHAGGPVITMALGDSPNDLPMLAAVDMPVLLPDANGGYADLHLPKAIRASEPSSRGWNRQVLAFLRIVGLEASSPGQLSPPTPETPSTRKEAP